MPFQIVILWSDALLWGLLIAAAALGFAARALGRPVKWQAERLEDFLSAVHGRDLITDAELALDADGRVLALRCESIANVGAAAITTGVLIQLMIGPWVTTSIYDIPLIALHATAVLTNTAATGAYRGAGRPEAIYTMERLMDAAAHQLGLDPADLVGKRNSDVFPGEFGAKLDLDDRRVCLECKHLSGHGAGSWRCGNWKEAGVAISSTYALLPADLVMQLQLCNGFTLHSTSKK